MKYAKYITPLKIHDIVCKNNVILAPMAGITDLPFRKLCSEYGLTLSVTEMVSAKGLWYGDGKTKSLLKMFDGEFPKIVQIFGSDENILGSVAKQLDADSNVDVIDINMGCPAPKVTKNGDGAELLKNIDKIDKILKAVVSNTSKPVTVKTRLGYYMDKPTIFEVARLCEKYNIALLTIHGRYKEQYFLSHADYSMIKEVKEKVNLPIVVNGDITNAKEAQDILEYTKCDGIMIGRQALGKPWIFKSILEGYDYEPTIEERFNVIYKHIGYAVECDGEKVAIPKLRKHIGWYIQGLKNATYIRTMVNQMTTKDEVIALLNKYEKSI